MRVRITGEAGCIGALAGAVAGFLPVAWLMAPECIDRWLWAASGGGGERASWGEPLFYLLIFGVPVALVGAAAGALIGRGIRAIRARGSDG
jgi:hypothetical protein